VALAVNGDKAWKHLAKDGCCHDWARRQSAQSGEERIMDQDKLANAYSVVNNYSGANQRE
jgi:hypothetical protein